MILNIDLGALYIKVSVVSEDILEVAQSEIIRLEEDSISVIEVLITAIIDVYSENFNIKRVNILPNLKYIDCEIVRREAIIESKFEKLMIKSIKDRKREEKRKESMGDEYEQPELKMETQPNVDLGFPVLKREVFYTREKQTLMNSEIYIEYVDSEYVKQLNKMVNTMGKEVFILSPVRALLELPFPKNNRIIVDYGHKNILIAVIEVDKEGNEFIREISKETIDDYSTPTIKDLTEKHTKATLDNDPVYLGKLGEIRKLKAKYPEYQIQLIGGNANFIQKDLMMINKLSKPEPLLMPLTGENLLIKTMIVHYESYYYNNASMKIKNRILNLTNMSSKAADMVVSIAGDVAIAALVLAITLSYGVNAEYVKYTDSKAFIDKQVNAYVDSGDQVGRITALEKRLEGIQTGKTKNYYNIAELLNSLASPLEVETIEVNGNNIKMVAYASDVALVKQFIETVKIRQSMNDFTKITLKEKDIKTVYRNGGKVDRVIFEGKVN